MTRYRFLALCALLLFVQAGPAGALPATPVADGPDVPAIGTPTVVDVFADERFECVEAAPTRTIAVPAGTWDRIIAVYSVKHDTDPWDRLFGVAIEGVEVLRGTTPRTSFTVRRDVTQYSSLLPPGGTADVSILVGTYVGSLRASLRLEFYANEPTGLVQRRGGTWFGPMTWRRLNGNNLSIEAPVAFPAEAADAAQVEITLTGHGTEEFW
jgi:hypothetical protein